MCGESIPEPENLVFFRTTPMLGRKTAPCRGVVRSRAALMRHPADIWRYVAAGFIILVTAGTSVQLYRGERRREQLRLESSFRVLAGDRVHNVLHQLERNLEVLQALEAWLISEMETGRYE